MLDLHGQACFGDRDRLFNRIGGHLKITAQATMVMSAIFAAICLYVAITGFNSLGELADPSQLADAKGYVWFWIFLAGVAALFALAGWWAARTQPEEEDA
jgi:hypothetical protein